MSENIDITLTINGRSHAIRVEPRKTLVDAIRDDCGQTGTHIGCEHGVCGTCTVIIDGEAVRACLMFAVQAQGKTIRTIEGLGTSENLHPLQRAFIAHHALQCGFCTPGFLMLAANALEQNPDIGDEELLDVLSSNLCRCTGYQNIIKAVCAVRDEMRGAKATSAVTPPRTATIRSHRRRAVDVCCDTQSRVLRICRSSPGVGATLATSTFRISSTCVSCARPTRMAGSCRSTPRQRVRCRVSTRCGPMPTSRASRRSISAPTSRRKASASSASRRWPRAMCGMSAIR